MSRRLTTLLLFVFMLAPAGAHAGESSTVRPPTLLWKTYPLEQPSTTTQKTPAVPAAPAHRKAPVEPQPSNVQKGQTGFAVRQAAPQRSGESAILRNTLLLGLVLATLVAMTAIVLVRSSVPIPVIGSRSASRRSRPRSPNRTTAAESSHDLVEALRPKPQKAPELVAPQAPPQAVAAPPRPTVQEQVTTAETCEIRLWRGFAKCRLYVTLASSEEAFFVSPYFRLRDEQAPKADAKHALAGLLAELERDGWTVVSDGPNWYRYRLERLDS